MNRKFIVITVVLAVISFCVPLAIVIGWSRYVVRQDQLADYESAKELLKQSQPDLALKLAHDHKQDGSGAAISENQWAEIEVEAWARLRQIPQLMWMHNQSPHLFEENEEATTIVLRALKESGGDKRAEEIRDQWRGRESDPALWLAYDADNLIRSNKSHLAAKLLESQELPGKEDSKRLARLSILNAKSDATKSWEQLTEAYSKNPRDPDVRSFRGQIFESAERHAEARVEYVAAHLSAPQNPIFADQLAEFYIRRRNYPLAVETWSKRLESPSSQFIWLKTMFWTRVASPRKIQWRELEPPRGDYTELLEFVRDLPTGTFWNDAEANRLIGVQQFLGQRQEVYWLQLLQLLKNGKEEETQVFIEHSPFRSQSWHPELESRLVQALDFRLRNRIKPKLHVVTSRIKTTRHSAFVELEHLNSVQEMTDELKTLLNSEEAFAAMFLAGGWPEAALQMRRHDVLPTGLPDWYVYGIGQALRMNRSAEAALAFLQKQKYDSPLIRLQIAELRLFTGDESADQELDKLAQLDSDVGFRAGFILCTRDLAEGKTQQVRMRIGNHPKLRTNIVALEMVAATLLMEDRPSDAEKIYSKLGDRSSSGLKYRMRKAFRSKDWQTAEELNEKLIKMFPDSMQLRQNVLLIEEAKKKTS